MINKQVIDNIVDVKKENVVYHEISIIQKIHVQIIHQSKQEAIRSLLVFIKTSHATAYSIPKTGFQHSKDGWIGQGTYFAASLNHTKFKANQFGAYICAIVDSVYYQHPQDT